MPSTSDLMSMMQNLEASYPGIVSFLFGFCYVVAFWFAFSAILDLKQMGDGRLARGRSSEWDAGRSAFVNLVVAAMVFNLPEAIKSLTVTVFMNATGALDYGSMQETISGPLKSIVHFVNIVGLITFIRGCFVMRAWGMHGEGGHASMSKAVVLLGAGTLALNFTMFMQTISATFGLPFIADWVK